MTDVAARTPSQLAPSVAWTVISDAPLKGLSLAREANLLLAWDDSQQVFLLDESGAHRAASRLGEKILGGAISDDGSLVALVGERRRLWLLDGHLRATADRETVPDPTAVAVDPHGRFVAVASKMNVTQIYNRNGKMAARFETRQALSHLVFAPSRPAMVGAAAYGTIAGIELRPKSGTAGGLIAEVEYQENLMSNVGRLACSGDGGMVLAACYTHGIQRFDPQGQNEGSYHLGGSASHAVPDFAGRMIAVATFEGDLSVVSPAGVVRYTTTLPRPANSLEVDALGRYIVYGLPTGEITRLDLRPAARADGAAGVARAAPQPRAASGPVRKPDWTANIAHDDEGGEFAVLAIVDDPPVVGVMTPTNTLTMYAADGRKIGQAPEISGVGRILRTAPGWIAAATDRMIVACDLRRNQARRLDLSLVELTHLAVRDDFGLAVVQERDRIGRATASGRWVWRRELDVAVEDLAIGPAGTCAATTDDGLLRLFDAAGEPAGTYAPAKNGEPLALIEAPAGSPAGVAYLSLARRQQVARGHDAAGRVLWESPVPWEAWQFLRVDALALAVAVDGRVLALDGGGHARAQSQGQGGDGARDAFVLAADGQVCRLARQGVHLICTDLAGRVRWRGVSESIPGPLAASAIGVAVVLGRDLAWFGPGRA